MEYGIQMYSVRDITEKNMDGALKALAEMGYKFVEFAGFFGIPADEIKAMLDKYGSIAVFLTRFFPIIRTFAPFLAGMGEMHFGRFTLFNVLGGVTWVCLFTLLGYFFGGVPFVQDHFELVIIGIVVISFIPTVAGLVKAKMSAGKKKRQQEEMGE